mmetsp:Transcript_103309/g.200179  ORF Transcript_103309/g.200179 Transcript_103309/m.200179 type:complete len:88 (+) Transcript_103309:958-1221(+)|eukprot:CAMPEP_0172721786 /NCGR_PEP_ID=MMETSP1074-20121228/79879_1 /TAXON_ID=2916 /ORGANISM="Ceratium fusus, Strain PA161109" /LENGTH=87 /DNA_ID=CAMNT_0013547615 /DNA_START=255 /DNA_END=518 /DNA_ORIENTATION=-
MIATEKEEVLRILDLVGKKQRDGFKTLLSPVNIITQEQVVALRGKTAILEQAQKVMVLTVDVTTDFEWGFKFKKRCLLEKYLTRRGT